MSESVCMRGRERILLSDERETERERKNRWRSWDSAVAIIRKENELK